MGKPRPRSRHRPRPMPGPWPGSWKKCRPTRKPNSCWWTRGKTGCRTSSSRNPGTIEQSYGPVSGVAETVDPELAKLRYRLWRRVMAPELTDQSVPLLLGRASRPLFLTLKGWPDWTALRKVQLSLPGCRNGAEWLKVAGEAGQPPWQEKFVDLLGALLTAAADNQELEAASRELQEFVDDDIVAGWPLPEVWNWDLEIWGPDAAPEANGPVLCWGSAGAGILPG